MEQEQSVIEIEQNSRRVIVDWYPYGLDGLTRHSVIKRIDFSTNEIKPVEVSFSNYSGWHAPEQARQHIAEMEIVLGIAKQLDALLLTRDHFTTRRIYVRQIGTWFDVGFEAVETEQKED